MASIPFPRKKIEIRQACEEDCKGIFRLVHKSFSGYVSEDNLESEKKNPALEETINEIRRDIRENIVLIIGNGEELLGTLRLEYIEQQKYFLKRFAILPTYQHQGLGTMLFYAAEREVKRNKGRYIYLYSSIENDILVTFYQGLGFNCLSIDIENGYQRGLWVKKFNGVD